MDTLQIGDPVKVNAPGRWGHGHEGEVWGMTGPLFVGVRIPYLTEDGIRKVIFWAKPGEIEPLAPRLEV